MSNYPSPYDAHTPPDPAPLPDPYGYDAQATANYPVPAPPYSPAPASAYSPAPAHPYSAPSAAPYAPQYPAQAYGTPEPAVSSAHIAIAWVFAVLTLGYLLPWAIAATRRTSSALPVFLLNLFLGWTVVGWFGSLIWGIVAQESRPAPSVVIVTPTAAPGPQQNWGGPQQGPQDPRW